MVDYTGHNLKATVKHGKLIITVPANKDGRGYLVMAPPGITGSFVPDKKSVTQEWDASKDLSIRPASDKKQLVCRIWVDKNTKIVSTLLDYNTHGWTGNTSLELEIDKAASTKPVASLLFKANNRGQLLKYAIPAGFKPGYYSFWVRGVNLPAVKDNWWFNLQNTYTAPQR